MKHSTSGAKAQIGRLPIHLPEWAELKSVGRYLTGVAVEHGIEVTYNQDMGSWVWTGTKEQWLASRLFPVPSRWGFKRHSHFFTPRGVRGTMRWAEDGRAMLSGIHFNDDSEGAQLRTLLYAGTDAQAAQWAGFKTKMLQAVDVTLTTEDAEAANKARAEIIDRTLRKVCLFAQDRPDLDMNSVAHMVWIAMTGTARVA